ncbi:MAG: hypothetical protein IPM15_18565 [Betaproteobacteria bacterium]|nr:hypothetical protein [Betaproteobacteria bacterium]MCC6247228.1 hypothetical protein [Rubrivivax sp.]MCL4698969.1 hypothetical protein [Burkholderiaceae bacterium]
MQLAIWIFTAVVVVLWLALGYGVATLASLAAGLQGMPAEWYELIGRVPGAPMMDIWLPGWREAVVQTAELVGVTLGWLGAALPALVWVVWGLGALCIIAFAAVLSGIVALARRKPAAPPRANLRSS